MPTFPALEPRASPWLGDLLLNGADQTRRHRCPLGPSPPEPAGRRAGALSPWHPPMPRIAAALEAAGLPVSGADSVTEDDWGWWGAGAGGAGGLPGSGRPHGRVGANAKLRPSAAIRLCAWRPCHRPGLPRQRRPDRLSCRRCLEEKAPLPLSMTPTARDTVIGELRPAPAPLARKSASRCWSSAVAGRAVSSAIRRHLRLRPPPGQAGLPRGGAVRWNRFEALSAWLLVEPTGQGDRQLRSSIAAHPECCRARAATTRSPSSRSKGSSKRSDRRPGGAALGKHLLEASRRSCSKQLVRRIGQKRSCRDHRRGPVRLQALVEEIYRRKPGRIRLVGWCAAFAPCLSTWSHPPARRCHCRPAGAPENNWWWAQLHPRLADTPSPGAARRIGLIAAFRRRDGREWDVQQELLLALDGLARLEPAWLSGKRSPCSWVSC